MLTNTHNAFHKSLEGCRYGRLIVLNAFTRDQRGWLQCRCDCGKLFDVRSQNLRNGRTKSCGCLREEIMAKLKYPIGDKHPNWNGGMAIDGRGYNRIWVRSHIYRFEHRIRAEKALGRLLPPNIPVHHHRDDSLVICQDQGYHMLLHYRMRTLQVVI